MPKQWVIDLCDLLGMDWLIIPTHSFDYQPVDCGAVWHINEALQSIGMSKIAGKFYQQVRDVGSEIPARMLQYCFDKALGRDTSSPDPELEEADLERLKDKIVRNPDLDLRASGYWKHTVSDRTLNTTASSEQKLSSGRFPRG